MTYASVVAADTPSHWWRFNEAGGNICHDNALAITLFPLWADQAGMFPFSGPSSDGGSISRNSSANVQNNNTIIGLGNTWSMEVWAWVSIPIASQDLMVCAIAGGAVQTNIRFNLGGTVDGYILGGPVCSYAGPVTLAQWHHYVLTYDHVNLRLYVDGLLRATTPGVVSTTGNFGVLIGQGRDGACQGCFADAAWYIGIVLSGAQVAAHFAAADIVGQTPYFLGSAGTVVVGGTPTVVYDTSELQAILAAVKKTFPTT